MSGVINHEEAFRKAPDTQDVMFLRQQRVD